MTEQDNAMLALGDAFVVVDPTSTKCQQYVCTVANVLRSPAEGPASVHVYAQRDYNPHGPKPRTVKKSQGFSGQTTPAVPPIHAHFRTGFDKSADKPYAFELPHIVLLNKKHPKCERALFHNEKLWIASSGSRLRAEDEGTIWRHAKPQEKAGMKQQRKDNNHQLYIFSNPPLGEECTFCGVTLIGR